MPVPTGIGQQACKTAGGVKDTVTGAPGQVAGEVAGAVSGSVFDQMTKWATEAASWLTGQIATAIERTSTPELGAGWYRQRFASMAALGLGLALLVAMVALGSAALRRDPDALGATLIGMFRAGLGTGLVLALTVLALGVADGITNAVAQDAVGKDAQKFWSSVGDAAKKLGDAPGDAAQAAAPGQAAGAAAGAAPAGKTVPAGIVFLLALGQVVVGLAVWIELLLRSAAIYVAVLFMPAALAASIWPSLRSWPSRLGRGLFVLIAMKPIVVTVLALAGSAAAAGLSGDARNGVGVLLAAVVIFALAAWAPWGLMHLVSIDHEGHWSASGGVAGARGAALAGGQQLGGGIRSGSSGARASSSGRGRGAGGGAGGGGGGGRRWSWRWGRASPCRGRRREASPAELGAEPGRRPAPPAAERRRVRRRFRWRGRWRRRRACGRPASRVEAGRARPPRGRSSRAGRAAALEAAARRAVRAGRHARRSRARRGFRRTPPPRWWWWAGAWWSHDPAAGVGRGGAGGGGGGGRSHGAGAAPW